MEMDYSKMPNWKVVAVWAACLVVMVCTVIIVDTAWSERAAIDEVARQLEEGNCSYLIKPQAKQLWGNESQQWIDNAVG